MQVELWVCPNGHYYGSSSVHGVDLASLPNHQADLQRNTSHDPAHPMITGNRGECQQCKAMGMSHQRQLIHVEVETPLPIAVA